MVGTAIVRPDLQPVPVASALRLTRALIFRAGQSTHIVKIFQLLSTTQTMGGTACALHRSKVMVTPASVLKGTLSKTVRAKISMRVRQARAVHTQHAWIKPHQWQAMLQAELAVANCPGLRTTRVFVLVQLAHLAMWTARQSAPIPMHAPSSLALRTPPASTSLHQSPQEWMDGPAVAPASSSATVKLEIALVH
jgi:hypothetical protein